MYAVESLNLCTTAVRELNVYWNSAYRKIFSYKPWESVTEVMKCLGKRILSLCIMKESCVFYMTCLYVITVLLVV